MSECICVHVCACTLSSFRMCMAQVAALTSVSKLHLFLNFLEHKQKAKTLLFPVTFSGALWWNWVTSIWTGGGCGIKQKTACRAEYPAMERTRSRNGGHVVLDAFMQRCGFALRARGTDASQWKISEIRRTNTVQPIKQRLWNSPCLLHDDKSRSDAGMKEREQRKSRQLFWKPGLKIQNCEVWELQGQEKLHFCTFHIWGGEWDCHLPKWDQVISLKDPFLTK